MLVKHIIDDLFQYIKRDDTKSLKITYYIQISQIKLRHKWNLTTKYRR